MLTIDLDRAAVEPDQLVLDLGCGAGRHSFAALVRGARVVSFDKDPVEVAKVAEMTEAMGQSGELDGEVRHSGTVGDLRRLPFSDRSFDRVFAAEVFEHIVDDELAMAEVARVLKPGGIVALTVPRAGPEKVNWMTSRAYHEVDGGHVRIYRRRALFRLMQDAGLRVLESHHAHALHSPYWLLRCVVGVERDDHPLVRAYHRLLVWDITRRPRVTHLLERMLNPLIGKSLVVYAERQR
jgi:SAM-dependent methyltransferase